MGDFGIGELSRRAGVAIANIRFYEQEKILPEAKRRNSRHRSYDIRDVKRLEFVRNCRKLGFTLEHVRALLHLAEPENLSCTQARALSVNQLRHVQDNIKELQRIERQLQSNIAACDAHCCNGRVPECGVLEKV